MAPVRGYSEMRDSGTTWLGCIPREWDISKIGSLYTLRNEKVSDKDYPPLSVTMKGIVPQLATAAKTDDGDNRKLVKVGDFAINSRSDRRGSCGISSYDGSVSLINTILTPRGQMHPGYYNWLFHTSMFADEFYKWGHGIVDDLWTTRWQEMKRILVPVPPYEIQSAIAAYLDKKCSKIDEIIASAKASIEDYKQWKASIIYEAVTKGLDPDVEMKDGGITCVNKVPKHWTVNRFGKIATVKSNLVNPKDYLRYKQISPENIEKGSGLLLDCGTVEESGIISGNHLFYKGQILYSKIRPTLNKVIIAPFDGLCSADIYPINTNHWPRFILYLMLSDYFNEQVALVTGNRVKMPKINQNELSQIIVAIPPDIEEQQRIAKYLDLSCSQIDDLIREKQFLIDDLDSYKKSLIYEVVTGKRRVY